MYCARKSSRHDGLHELGTERARRWSHAPVTFLRSRWMPTTAPPIRDPSFCGKRPSDDAEDGEEQRPVPAASASARLHEQEVRGVVREVRLPMPNVRRLSPRRPRWRTHRSPRHKTGRP